MPHYYHYGASPLRWVKPVVLALLLVTVDEQGLIAGLTGLVMLFIYLPRSFTHRFRHCRRERLIRFGIYLGAVVAVFCMQGANETRAKERATEIIVAVEAYRLKHGDYPERLEQLVPLFMPRIPDKARLTLSDTGFKYASSNGSHLLSYVALPPFHRRIYDFEAGKWRELD